MKGLLRKDFYLAGKYCRSFILIMAVFMAMTLFGSSTMFVFYPVMLAGLIPMTLQSYDEREKWSVYSLTLPVSRRTLVSVKYLFGLICVAIAVAARAVLQVIIVAVLHREVLMPLGMVVCAGIMVGLGASAIVMPFVFKLGAEKGRIAYLVVIAVVCAGSVALLGSLDDLAVGSLAALNGTVGCALPAVAGMVFYGLSWLLSMAFYEKRVLA